MDNADAKCISLGAQLVKIESAFENDFLAQAFFKGTSGTYWIGLSDQVHEGKWIWTDGSSLGADDYSPWGNNNPNNLGGHQNCGQIVKEISNWDHFFLEVLKMESGMTSGVIFFSAIFAKRKYTLERMSSKSTS